MSESCFELTMYVDDIPKVCIFMCLLPLSRMLMRRGISKTILNSQLVPVLRSGCFLFSNASFRLILLHPNSYFFASLPDDLWK